MAWLTDRSAATAAVELSTTTAPAVVRVRASANAIRRVLHMVDTSPLGRHTSNFADSVDRSRGPGGHTSRTIVAGGCPVRHPVRKVASSAVYCGTNSGCQRAK